MPEINLPEETRRVLAAIVEASDFTKADKFQLIQQIGRKSGIDFKGNEDVMRVDADLHDLELLHRYDLISLRCLTGGFYHGRLLPSGRQLVSNDFYVPDATSAITHIGQQFNAPLSGNIQAIAGTGNHATLNINTASNADLIAQLAAVTVDIVKILRELVPDDADVIESDANAVTAELSRPAPNAAAVASKVGSVISRSMEAIEKIGKSAETLQKIGDVAEKFGPWIKLAFHSIASHLT